MGIEEFFKVYQTNTKSVFRVVDILGESNDALMQGSVGGWVNSKQFITQESELSGL